MDEKKLNEAVEPEVVNEEPIVDNTVDTEPVDAAPEVVDNTVDAEPVEVVNPEVVDSGSGMPPIGNMLGGLFGGVPEEGPIPDSIPDSLKSIPFPEVVIKTATPMNIRVTNKNNTSIATIAFLCRDEEDHLFTVSKNYAIGDDKKNKEYIESLPFYVDNDNTFISQKICNTSIIKYLDNYVMNMTFKTDKEFEYSDDPWFKSQGTNSSTREPVTLKMRSEIYACLNFIDYYIINKIHNDHDLSIASVGGAKNEGMITKFFKVESIDSIITMARGELPKKNIIDKIKSTFTKEEENTQIAIVLKVSRIIDGKSDVAYILTPFDIGTMLSDENFKNDTIESIQDKYYGDSDQYVSTLFVDDTRITTVQDDTESDKNYMTIRAKNKDNNSMIFLFDFSMKEDLIKKIKEY